MTLIGVSLELTIFHLDSSPWDLTKELIKDLEQLEMKYKLKDNWQELDESLLIPFLVECSEIHEEAQK